MKRAVGLMSGTSMDGIDVALLATDGRETVELGPFLSVSYDPDFRERLKAGLETAKTIHERHERPGDLADLERDLTLRHVDAVNDFLKQNSILPGDIDVIGFHGQTVLHRPYAALTVQIGDGQLLADRTGIATVFDMRANDIAHGGQGAPLVPAYHAALAARLEDRTSPVCFVNIGGISNLTYIGPDHEIIAFDSGPGNTLIDQWVEENAGVPYDQGGRIASEGTIIMALADRYLDHPFFTSDMRRSLDRSDFRPPAADEAGLHDGARTLAYVTAASVMRSAGHLPAMPKCFIICGGGRLNGAVMEDLAEMASRHGAQVLTAEEAGFDGDAMEAEAWAYLAVRSLAGLPLTFPGTTGVARPMTGGVLARTIRA
nr:anhydro-N-acetylmuramic acid kinase [Ciceribacter sp. L1K23]